MHTGNIIGKRKIVYQGNAKGIWHQFDAFNLRQEKIWPTDGLYIVTQETNTSASITQPSETIAGDLLLFFNWGQNSSSSTPPTAVVPSGYSNFYDAAKSVSPGTRLTGYYKVADGTEAGVSVNGMDSTFERIDIYLLRWQGKAITSVSVSDVESDTTFTGTITKTVNVGGVNPPVVVFLALRSFYRVPYVYGSGAYELPSSGNFDTSFGTISENYNNPDSNPNLNTDRRSEVTTSGSYLKIFNYPGTSDIPITLKGDGAFDLMASGYITIS